MKYPSILNLRKRTEDGKNLILDSFANPAFEFFMETRDWIVTEKIDGTNIRIMFGEDGTVEFRGRTDNAQLHPNLIRHLQEEFQMDAQMNFPAGTILFGEGYGQGIQKGGSNYSPRMKFILFDIWSGSYWYEWEHLQEIADEKDISIVPEYALGNSLAGIENIVRKVGLRSNFGEFSAEGVVVRPRFNLLDSHGRRILIKIKKRDY